MTSHPSHLHNQTDLNGSLVVRWRVMLTKSITKKLRRHKDDLQLEIKADLLSRR